jgi:hypothetical protein
MFGSQANVAKRFVIKDKDQLFGSRVNARFCGTRTQDHTTII